MNYEQTVKTMDAVLIRVHGRRTHGWRSYAKNGHKNYEQTIKTVDSGVARVRGFDPLQMA